MLMGDRFEEIIDENANLKKALQHTKSIIERTSNDYETLRLIHEEFKIQSERQKRECEELQVKVISLSNDKKELEMQFDATIRNLKIAIDLKQREIEEVQAKIIPSFDQDMLRIKIINELEIPHRTAIESKQEEVDRMQEILYEYKRQIDMLQSKLEMQGKEYSRDLKSIKDRHSMEVNELTSELMAANEKAEDIRDKEQIRKLKRESDELKQKYQQKDTECDELRRERDRCREEKNECLIKFSKQIDTERNEKRLYKAESEKLSIRVRFLDEESKKNKIKSDSIQSDNEIQRRERDTFLEEIRKKDDLIHQLQRRITELEDDHVIQEGRALEKEQKIYNEERDKFLEERNRVISLQREFDQLKQNFSDVNEENKQLRVRIQKEVAALRTELTQTTEERDKLKRVSANLEKENQDERDEQLNELERELENVRRRYRESQQRIQNLESNVDTLQRYKSSIQVQNHISPVAPSTPNPVQDDSSSQLNQLKKDVEVEKRKNQKLKEKLKQANEKIMDLLQFKLKSQAQQAVAQAGNNVQVNTSVAQRQGSTRGAASLDHRDRDRVSEHSSAAVNPHQTSGPSSINPRNLQNQFNHSYSNSIHNQTNAPFGITAALSYEDERILQEINRASDNHRYNYV